MERGRLGGNLRPSSADLFFALRLWNGKDPILKERLFGLTGSEGNHGEDVKEIYYLPRFDADAFVHEVSVQVSAGRVSVLAAASTRTEDGARTIANSS